MLALAAPLASAAPLRFPYNFLLPPHSPVIPAHLKFPYRFCPPTRPAPASAQPSFCAGFAAQKLLIRYMSDSAHAHRPSSYGDPGGLGKFALATRRHKASSAHSAGCRLKAVQDRRADLVVGLPCTRPSVDDHLLSAVMDRFLTIRQVVELVGASRSSIYTWIKAGSFP